MKRTSIALVVLLIALNGCALTPTQKKALKITGGVLVVGAIAVHEIDHDSQRRRDITTPTNPCQTNPKSCQ